MGTGVIDKILENDSKVVHIRGQPVEGKADAKSYARDDG
jgi:hypothetical protein